MKPLRLGTLEYTPGYSGRAQPIPQDTRPTRILSSVIRGPPESPCDIKKIIIANRVADMIYYLLITIIYVSLFIIKIFDKD